MRRFMFLFLLIFFVTACYPGFSLAETSTHNKAKGARTKQQKSKGKAGKKKKVTGVSPRKPVSVVVAPLAVKESAVVKGMRYWSNPDYSRITISLDREVRFEYHQLPENKGAGTSPRLYIDLHGAKLAPGIKDLPIGDGLLKTARVAQYAADTVRVVLDLDSIRDCKVFTFSDPFSIIVDVKGERRGAEISATKEGIEAPTILTAAKSEKTEKAVAETVGKAVPVEKSDKGEAKKRIGVSPSVGKIRRIVVDPGHGGHDPGATGQGGTKEKDVVLQIGLKLAQRLREELGVDVVMTRSTDVFIELKERTAIANQVGADLFVSVHANASLNRNAAGIETYYLNLAKTEKAAQLAAIENGTSLEKVSLLQAVLFDLMANYKLNDSAHLADEVQKALYKKVNGGYAGVKNLGVKQGPFYVLVGATMPSILVETAFLSNEREEKRLTDPQYLETTVEGIMLGIKAYIAGLR